MLGVAGEEVVRSFCDLTGAHGAAPVDGAVVVAFRQNDVIFVNLQNDNAVGVVVYTENVAHTQVVNGDILGNRLRRQMSKSGIAEDKGKGCTAVADGIVDVPLIAVAVVPWHTLGEFVLHGNEEIVYILLGGSAAVDGLELSRGSGCGCRRGCGCRSRCRCGCRCRSSCGCSSGRGLDRGSRLGGGSGRCAAAVCLKQEGDHLTAGADIQRPEGIGACAACDVIFLCPDDGLCVPVRIRYVCKFAAAADSGLACRRIEEGDDLGAGAFRIGREGVRPCAPCDTLFHCPQHGLEIPCVVGNVVKGIDGGSGFGLALCRPQEGDYLRTGTGVVGAEPGGADAAGDALFHRPDDGIGKPVAVRHIGEGGACCKDRHGKHPGNQNNGKQHADEFAELFGHK